jgi:hypothetical protein
MLIKGCLLANVQPTDTFISCHNMWFIYYIKFNILSIQLPFSLKLVKKVVGLTLYKTY